MPSPLSDEVGAYMYHNPAGCHTSTTAFANVCVADDLLQIQPAVQGAHCLATSVPMQQLLASMVLGKWCTAKSTLLAYMRLS